MKAAAFDHVRAASLPEALALLARHGDGAKLLAGGQSLLPALNLRLSAPDILIDISRLAEMRGIALADGVLRLGALTRHAELARDPLVAAHAPLLARAAPLIAHPAIRSRGTLGGSLAHADPAAELPACMVALNARIVVVGPSGTRRIPAEAFFQGVFATALAPDEILTAVEIDALRPGERSACLEYARRAGDYALAGLAAHGAWPRLRLAYFGVADAPVLAQAAAAALPDLAAAEAALAQDLSPRADLQASSATRLQLARVLLRRAAAEWSAA